MTCSVPEAPKTLRQPPAPQVSPTRPANLSNFSAAGGEARLSCFHRTSLPTVELFRPSRNALPYKMQPRSRLPAAGAPVHSNMAGELSRS